MKRAALVLLALGLLLGAFAPSAMAHPLGNFSINHLTEVAVGDQRAELRYVLDKAEIPTFQDRGMSRAALLAGVEREVERRLTVTVDGRRVPLAVQAGSKISFRPGQGGLRTTRVEIPLSAPAMDAERVDVRDGTYAGRVGWRAIVAQPGENTAVRSTAPSGDPTDRLTAYPEDRLKSPLDVRSARLSVESGDGTLVAPKSPGGENAVTKDRGGDGLAGVFERAASGQGVLLLLLLAAFAWGAVHALSPGHGKAMVAAYLVGTRGTAKHAVALGATVTITHTLGVFALGFVTLALSQYVLPEDLYPWLNLVSGLLVVLVGLAIVRSRVRWYRARRAGDDFSEGASAIRAQEPRRRLAERFPAAHRRLRRARDVVVHTHANEEHGHGRGHSHHHAQAHSHAHDHDPGHDHEMPSRVTAKHLIAMGASAGLIPCPSALVVLLGAISQQQVGLGLLLIVAFSLGLAATLTGLGLAVVYARRLTGRLNAGFSTRFGAALPAASAVAILGVGCILTLQAVPKVV